MVTAKILGFELSNVSGYISINIEYDINGKKVVNPYLLDYRSMIGKTLQEITDYIDGQILFQVDRYIESEFRRVVNDDSIKKVLVSLVGKTYQKDVAELTIDSRIITAKTDGTYIEKV